MNARFKRRGVLAASAIATIVAGGLWTAPASAQMFREPFTFTNRNPESMAVYMRQRDDANKSSTTAVAGSSENPTLVCSGTGETTATAAGNIMCVLAGSGANVIVGSDQENDGSHSADAETNKTTGEEISSILYGDEGDQ